LDERRDPVCCIPSPDEIAAIEVELALNRRARTLEEAEQPVPEERLAAVPKGR
jgi:hypothetical protein